MIDAAIVDNLVHRALAEARAEDFEYTSDGASVTITKYFGKSTKVVIPSTINGLPVVGVGNKAFANCYKITSINIPPSVTSIGELAFAYCGNLTSVNIPPGVTGIGSLAFASCYNLTSITIPPSVTSRGYAAFAYCSSLTSANIHYKHLAILAADKFMQFYACYTLKAITVYDDEGNTTELPLDVLLDNT